VSGVAPTPLAAIVTTDFAGITRGRSIPADRLDGLKSGIGWLPANLSLTPFDGIATPNPWGSQGDLRVMPDLDARFRTSATGTQTPFDMVMGDIVELDGSAWRGCARSLLRDALATLRDRHGIGLRVSFEQEFQLFGHALPAAHALSFAALRRADPFGPTLFAALEEAGIEPEVMIAEFGRDQFEITCAPSGAVTAADRAIAIREIAREVARASGWHASFAPKTAPDGVGNGVHIHISLWDGSRPITRDPKGPNGLSGEAGAFFAGIAQKLPALVAFTAPSPPSYLRLRPHSWSAAYNWMADCDREAALRICPTWTAGGGDADRQCNVEFRATDATANPYLALYAIVRAGLVGLDDTLVPLPAPADHPAELDEAALAACGIVRLPETLEAAIDTMTADAEVSSWLAPDILETFLGVRRAELARVADLDPAAACELYRWLY
jgi:glutamine synthetase